MKFKGKKQFSAERFMLDVGKSKSCHILNFSRRKFDTKYLKTQYQDRHISTHAHEN